MSLVLLYFSSISFAAEKVNFKVKGINVLFSDKYFGMNAVSDIKSLEAKNVVVGGGLSKDKYYQENKKDWEERTSLEVYLGKHFTKVEPLNNKATIDLAAGLNSEEGVLFLFNMTFKYSDKFGYGLTLNTSNNNGFLLNLNFSY
jgi:hypothetical protein